MAERSARRRRTPAWIGESPRVETSERYGALLIALTATFFYGGVAQPGQAQRAISTVLSGATLLLALWLAEIRPDRFRIAVVAVGLLVAGVVIVLIAGKGDTLNGVTAIANGMLVGVAPVALVRGLLRQVRRTGMVNPPVVAGVLCLYLFVGLFFAYLFVGIQNLGGGPFFTDGRPATSADAMYFSFVTITTVGYGDFTARSNLGHMLAVTEALLGQIYLVTIVAAIVSRMVPRRPGSGVG